MLEALLNEKQSGNLKGIYGRLVRFLNFSVAFVSLFVTSQMYGMSTTSSVQNTEAPSTRTRVNLKPGKYFHGYAYRPHVTG